ncbi:MAG TPA: hypothetical protein VK028_09750 [Micromonosporaceae bacterium]|nr:hypothetical protein [Micromonosporaceae bacterium]
MTLRGDSVGYRYLQLGLRLGRHNDGVVDAYFGPPELSAAVAAEPLVDPRALVAEAEALLNELDDGWLHDQVTGLHTFARVLAGESLAYGDESRGYYGVPARRTDESVFIAAHRRLDELLPGTGSVAERRERWKDAMLVPGEAVERIATAVIAEARRQTSRLAELPQGEGIDLEVVHDEPWIAYNFYLGDLRGRVAVNVDLPMSAMELLRTALHEAYPGHQAERSIKEHRLVRGRRLVEETIVLVPTPQSLLTEGTAELAPYMLLDGGGGDALAAIVRDAGIVFDLPLALEIERASEPCRWAEVNAAFMLHEDGAEEAEVHEYLQRWGLMGPDLARHLVRFMKDPTSRTYIMTYPAGFELCRSYVAGRPERFRRLLSEQLRLRDLVGATLE